MIINYSDYSYEQGTRYVYTKDKEYNIVTIGSRSYVAKGKILVHDDDGPGGHILIGNYSSIASDVEFLLYGNYDYKAVSTYPWFVLTGKKYIYNIRNSGQVIIGNDVWIGNGCKIIGGTIIGNGAVIGAGTVVNKSIPPYAIVCGNRAEIIGYRFTPEQIAKLNKLKWWYWDEKDILAKNDLFRNIDSFLNDSYLEDDYAEEAWENEQLKNLKERFSFIYYLLLDSEAKYPLWPKVIAEYVNKFSAADSVLLLIGVKDKELLEPVKKQIDNLLGDAKPAVAFIADNGMRAREIMRYADCFISTRQFSSIIYNDYAKKTVSALNTRIFY